MGKFYLVDLDTNRKININDDEPTIIGRGDLDSCSDNRVSRKHGKLYNTDGELHIIALHNNPCFHMDAGLPPVRQIKKGEDKLLRKGDCIALLPDKFWFQVTINSQTVADHLNNLPSTSTSHQTATLDDNDHWTTPDKFALNVTMSPQPEIKLPSDVSPCSSPNGDEENIASSSSTSKKIVFKVRKLPEWMYEVEKEYDKTTGKREADKEEDVEDVAKKKKKKEEDTAHQTNTTPDKPSSPQPVDVSVPQPSTSTGDKDGYESEVIEPELPAPADNNIVPVPALVQAPVAAPVTAAVPAGGAVIRAMCQYGAGCYRKNVQHKQDFAHPGDADYLAEQDRPVCPYGLLCYRQNPMHRTEYQHPGLPVPVPAPAATGNPPSPQAPLPKKRQRKTNHHDTSDEDDYDLDDPFMNDGSSDEYLPTDELDSESELDSSQCTEEDLTRLKKEAKRICKQKKRK